MRPLRLGKRFLARGESLVATLGLGGSLILMAATATSWWWTVHTHRRTLLDERRRQIGVAAAVAARGVESLLASGDLSAARCIVADLARETGASEALLIVPGGRVLAAANPASITLADPPAAWPTGDAAAPEPASTSPDALVADAPVSLAPDSRALLHIQAPMSYPGWANWQIQVGAAAVAVVGLGTFLGVYHRVRTRMRAVGAVGDALRCLLAGEESREVLEVSEGFGDTARAWNTLLRERETLRKQLSLERSGQSGSAARRRDEHLADACDAMWHGLVVVDEHLRVRYANGAASIFLGAARDRIQGAEAPQAIPFPPVLDALAGIADRTLRSRTVVEVEPESGHDTILRYSIRPMRKSDTLAAMILIEDVTQQRLADRSRNAFVAQATHELRTPLTNIRLYVEELVDHEDQEPAERARCLNVVNEEVRRLERIVGDMLSVAELEAGSLALEFNDVRLDALFQQIEAEFQIQARDKKVRLEFHLPPKLPVVRGDRDKVMICIANLVGNAIKYTPAGGEVKVTVSVADGTVSVEVADTGFGISENEAELVFEKFYRAKDKRLAGITGSGLGLALARQIARLHSGDIRLASVLDKGSTFTLTLPAAAPVSLAA